jgi:hypothetical protein
MVTVDHVGIKHKHLQPFVSANMSQNIAEVKFVVRINGLLEVIVEFQDPTQSQKIEDKNYSLRKAYSPLRPLVEITDKGNTSLKCVILDKWCRVGCNYVHVYTPPAAGGAASAPAPATVVPNNVLNGPFGGWQAVPTIAAISNGASASAQAPPASMKAPVAGGAGGASALPGFGEALVAFDKSQAAAPAPAPVAPAAHGGGASAQSAVGTTKRTAIVIDDDDVRPNKKMRS